MLGYLLGGTSVGFLSFQAYKKRQAKKKADEISEQVQENILSPHEWSEGEDVYFLQSQLFSKQLEANNISDYQRKPYFQKTREIISKTFLQFKTNQMNLFQKKTNENNSMQDQNHILNDQKELGEDQKSKNQTENLMEQTIRSTGLQNIYLKFLHSYKKKNDEKQLEQFKKQIISPSQTRKESSPQKIKRSPSPKSSPNHLATFEENDLISKQNSLFSYIEGSQQHEVDNNNQVLIPIKQFENNFNESKIGKKSILYTEYKGNKPSEALKEFLSKCEKHLPIKNAMIISYYFGQGDPTSYVIAVEYNPAENDALSNIYSQIDGAKKAELKKTDAFKFDYNLQKQNYSMDSQTKEHKIQLNNWLEFGANQNLRNILEQEIESKIHISGVRQMKYIEVFSLDENKNITSYQVQVPYGQNESAYDLRSKSQAQDIQYHDSFRQYDIYSNKAQ
ncbi:hypothetical protein TTHERM_000161539 (macronuclear) [Tetrahymena thermophila SB210]|uniref:Uncharacterized protein n=1 Tax=Tetrahymena thermophila (strain SB210) TaxID=312017 RepID=W7X983_TETTS|nr:hypothetical protein TTHERM_000161539 [Tetrahymena thermophila SB210]EWS75950.1 hypothetical protein TTHERM_000161539 [Tetrahymena thermophila SB210]|eukprot:XP_012651468.1 hypothetical protein TTHERM_000161539 [Tetrahymena thermophila SB210]